MIASQSQITISANQTRKRLHPSQLHVHEVESAWARRLADPAQMNYQETKAWMAALSRVAVRS